MNISLDQLYWLVKKRVKILEGFNVILTGASNSNPIVITSQSAHQYQTGQLVKIEGIKGNTAANGSFYVKVLTPTKFEVYKVLNAVSNATNTSPILLTLTGHNFRTAERITVLGIEGNTSANGTFYVKQSGKPIVSIVGTPVLNITTFANTNPVVVTVLNHGLTTGDLVNVYTPSVAATITGQYYVNVLNSNDFEIFSDQALTQSVNGTLIGAYEGNGTIQKLAPLQVTVLNHGYSNKDAVKIIDVVGEPSANGGFYVKVLGPHLFELYADTAISIPIISTGTYVSGGIVAPLDNYDLELFLDNQLTLPSSGNGNYVRNGYVFSFPAVGNGDYIEGGYVKKDFTIENDFKDTFPGVPSNIYESIVKRIRS